MARTELTKTELIEQIIPLLRLPLHEQPKMSAELATHTVPELRAYLEKVSSSSYQRELQEQAIAEVEDQIIQVQAQREADRVLFILNQQKATEPKRKADAAKKEVRGREIFSVICRRHNLSECEANFRALFDSDLLGSVFAADQAIVSNAVSLAKADPETSSKFDQERVQSHNDSLQRMDTAQLKARVRQEAADSRATAVQQEADRQFEASRARDAVMGFPPLPGEFTKDSLLHMVKNDTQKYKFLLKKFGNANITARLNGRG
jgi:hypothetical protein